MKPYHDHEYVLTIANQIMTDTENYYRIIKDLRKLKRQALEEWRVIKACKYKTAKELDIAKETLAYYRDLLRELTGKTA